MPPDLIMSQQCLLWGIHTQRSKIKMLRFPLSEREKDRCGAQGHSGGNRTAVEQRLSENSSSRTTHLLDKKQSLVVLWSSHMAISSPYCLLSLCTFHQLFSLFLFPQPGISHTMSHYAESHTAAKVCDRTCSSLGTVKSRCRALKVISHVA